MIYNFMFSILPGSPTGLAMSVLNRTKGFYENKIDSTILAPTFNRYHSRDMSRLKQKQLLKVPVHYMFDDLGTASERVISLPDPVNGLVNNNNLQIISDENPLIKRLFNNGEYKYFVKYSNTGNVNYIKCFENQVFANKTSYYDDRNMLSYEEFYFPSSNSLLSKVYYDDNGRAFLRYLFKKNGELYNIIHFPSNQTFKNEQELIFFWLSNILPKNQKIAIISEYAVYKKALLRVKENLALGSKLIFTLHNNHFSSPYTTGSPIRNDFKTILNHLDEVKNVVVLTKEQKEDLVEEFGHSNSFFYVPHAARKFNGGLNVSRKPYTITVGSRFEKIKGIEDTIYAFSKVLKKIPNAHLNIIGKGPEKANYEKIINSLNIKSQCSIIDFVSDLPLEYAKSDISVFTSYYEGFHLSLIEAMSAGAVPVVFPYKYGPKDIIENGVTGIITEEKDIDELAHNIVSLLNNREKLSKMRIAAMKVPELYSVKNNVEHWEKTISEAKE